MDSITISAFIRSSVNFSLCISPQKSCFSAAETHKKPVMPRRQAHTVREEHHLDESFPATPWGPEELALRGHLDRMEAPDEEWVG